MGFDHGSCLDVAWHHVNPDPNVTRLTPEELLAARIDESLEYTRRKGRRFKTGATTVHMASLLMTGTATVLLGLADMSPLVGVGLTLTGLTTVIGAFEPFFNYRSRWVIMEDGRAKLHRLKEDLKFQSATSPDGRLSREQLEELHERSQHVWTEMSNAWVSERRRSLPR